MYYNVMTINNIVTMIVLLYFHIVLGLKGVPIVNIAHK